MGYHAPPIILSGPNPQRPANQRFAMRRIIALFAMSAILAGAWGVATPGPADAAPALKPCGTIDSDRKLGRDCAGPLVISANNIRVDLGGRKVTCQSNTTDGIILEGRTGVRVIKGHVHGCSIGVRIDGGSGNTLESLHIDGNAWQGILVRGSSNNVIRLTQVLTNGTTGRLGARGVMVRRSEDGTTASDNNLLDRVTARQNTAYGIEINGSAGNRITGSAADANATGGIAIDGGATGTIVDGSSGSGNGGFGIFVSGNGTAIASSTFSSNSGTAGWGVQLSATAADTDLVGNVIDGNLVGIRVGGPDNLIADNTLSGNTRDGIAVGTSAGAAGPTGNEVSDNAVSGSGRYDLADFVAGACTANAWHGNSGARVFDGCETAA